MHFLRKTTCSVLLGMLCTAILPSLACAAVETEGPVASSFLGHMSGANETQQKIINQCWSRTKIRDCQKQTEAIPRSISIQFLLPKEQVYPGAFANQAEKNAYYKYAPLLNKMLSEIEPMEWEYMQVYLTLLQTKEVFNRIDAWRRQVLREYDKNLVAAGEAVQKMYKLIKEESKQRKQSGKFGIRDYMNDASPDMKLFMFPTGRITPALANKVYDTQAQWTAAVVHLSEGSAIIDKMKRASERFDAIIRKWEGKSLKGIPLRYADSMRKFLASTRALYSNLSVVVEQYEKKYAELTNPSTKYFHLTYHGTGVYPGFGELNFLKGDPVKVINNTFQELYQCYLTYH